MIFKTLQLTARARQHDADAFTQLIDIYKKDLYTTAVAILRNDYDAADAIQDAILTCWEKIPTLQQDRIALACSQIQTKGRKRTVKTQNRSGKIVAGIAVAACAAVCIGVSATHGPQNTTDLASSDGASTSTLAEVVPSENPFVIKVNAAELTENVHLPINIDTALSDNWVQNILSDDDHTILTNVNIPVTVEGDNISTVTFTVSNGFF